MKILFCTTCFEKTANGPAKFAKLLLDINREYPNHDLRILSEDVKANSQFVYKLNLKYPPSLKKFSHLFRIFQYHRKAIAIKSDFNWDVVVYNNSFLGIRTALSKYKSIGMINDYNNYSEFKFKYDNIRSNILRILEKYSIKHHSGVILNSNYMKNFFSCRYKKYKIKFHLLYKGVKLNKEVKKKAFSLKPVKILFVKKDYKKGGLVNLIKAISNIDLDIDLKIVGPSINELNQNIKKLIKASSQTISVLGYLNQKEVMILMEESDIFCVPSYQEALGVANMEAINHGCAVISSNIGGIPEVLDNGKNGWIVGPDDIDKLRDSIVECCLDSKKREIKILNAYDFITKFDIDNTKANFIAILTKILA